MRSELGASGSAALTTARHSRLPTSEPRTPSGQGAASDADAGETVPSAATVTVTTVE